VPIFGCRIWHMSDDRQVGGTLGIPLFGADLHSTICESFPRDPHPPLTHHRMRSTTGSQERTITTTRKKSGDTCNSTVNPAQMRCHSTVNCQRSLDWNPLRHVTLRLATYLELKIV
jgi:hypothetical protein